MREIRSPLDGIPSPFAAGPAAPFTPASLFASGEDGAWYDPSDLTTLFQDRSATPSTPVTADGDVVGTVLDKSGNGNHAIAPSDAARPLYKTAGGLHWLEFDGVDDYFSATMSGLSANSVNALAFNPESSSNYIATSLSLSALWHYAQSGSVGDFDAGVGSPSYRLNGADITYTDRGDTNSTWANSDNVSLVENLDLSSAVTFYFPTYGAGAGLFMTGKVFGTLLLDRALTTTERDNLEAYLAAKSGVTL